MSLSGCPMHRNVLSRLETTTQHFLVVMMDGSSILAGSELLLEQTTMPLGRAKVRSLC